MAQPHTRFDRLVFQPYRFREFPKQAYRAVMRDLMIDEMDDKGIMRARKHRKPVIEVVNVPNSGALKELGKDWLTGTDGYAKCLTAARKMGERGELIRMITIEQFDDLTQEAQEVEEEPQITVLPPRHEKKKSHRPKGAGSRRAAKEAAQVAAE